MAELTPSQRALQILAEIEMEENLKNDIKQQFDNQKNVSTVDRKAEEKKVSAPIEPVQTINENNEPAEFNINKLTKDDIINGIIFSELINKPLALRQHRRL
jgi:hypothetical protein